MLGNKRENGHPFLGSKKGPGARLGIKEKMLNIIKDRRHDPSEKEHKSPLER
jgi:hypothetical protein